MRSSLMHSYSGQPMQFYSSVDTRRSTLAYHVHRPARLGSSALISESWHEIYRRKVADLHATLNDDEATCAGAMDILRSPIDAIVLAPESGELKIELRGDLAGILNVATNEKSPSSSDGLMAS